MYHRLFWRYIVNCADIYAGGKDPSWTVPARHPGPENSTIKIQYKDCFFGLQKGKFDAAQTNIPNHYPEQKVSL